MLYVNPFWNLEPGTVHCIHTTAAYIVLHSAFSHVSKRSNNSNFKQISNSKAIDDDNGLVYTQWCVTMHKNKKILFSFA